MPEHPLSGRVVVVTRPAKQAGELAGPLEDLGAEVLRVPTIRIVPVPLNDEIRGAVARLPDYELVVFTSVNGVAEFLARMRECGVGPEALAGATVAAVGPRTAVTLAARGVGVDVVPQEYVAEGLLAAFDLAGIGTSADPGRGDHDASVGAGRSRQVAGAQGAPIRILFPRAREAREVLPDTLRGRGAVVDVLPVYETVPADRLAVPLDRIVAADYLTFTAASAARRFVGLAERALRAETPGRGAEGAGRETPTRGAGPPLAERLAGARIASIGPATSEAVRALGLTVALETAHHDVHGLVSTIVADVASRRPSA